MSGELIELELIDSLKAIECPTRGFINFPCAICQECEIGAVEVHMEDGILIEKTVNSMLIHLDVGLRENDGVEKAALDLLKSSLSVKVPALQKGNWDGGDLTILLTDELAKDTELISNIQVFLKEFPVLWRQLAIQAKRALSEWSKNNTKQIAHKYFREM